MTQQGTWTRRRTKAMVAVILGASFQLGFLQSCDERLIQATRLFDPCGTFLANCAPGDIEASRAAVGDFCVDPACTVPGQCGQGQPLGTITDVCP